jgi:hypothetical protein
MRNATAARAERFGAMLIASLESGRVELLDAWG